MTGLFNRRYFENYIASFFKEEKEGIHSIVLCDIDYFKSINDKYGHFVGDAVIKHVANIINNGIKAEKVFVRFGGDELMIFLPYRSAKQSYAIAEAFRKEVEQQTLLVKEYKVGVTISIGISSFQHHHDLSNTIIKADQALYQAKEQGRNQVAITEEN
ncbi:diguanylate cyclase (GGDEF)-like protein [Metabacillus malikii]|uniref:Diguanylate cyclase (GGDEF)-like protein n=1 Tax=Metabacillus malikii TaxID=1504265 RepID=A0ABT9ZJG0_9BACI|nr:diguanylate cyclase (GGDEF)-like protein [Metabacillus malikii]